VCGSDVIIYYIARFIFSNKWHLVVSFVSVGDREIHHLVFIPSLLSWLWSQICPALSWPFLFSGLVPREEAITLTFCPWSLAWLPGQSVLLLSCLAAWSVGSGSIGNISFPVLHYSWYSWYSFILPEYASMCVQ
jgi:hypothetical protein